MSDLKVSEAHLQELRKVHSMLHASMDALIRDMNANEAARLLILLDDRLTTLINTAAAEREPKSDRKRSDRPFTGVAPTMGEALPSEAPAEQPSTPAADPVAMPVAGISAAGKETSGRSTASVTEPQPGARTDATPASGGARPEPLRATPAASAAGSPATAKPSVAAPLTPKPMAPKAAIPLPPAPAQNPEPEPKAARPPESDALPDSGPILFVPPPPPPKPVRAADPSIAPAKAPVSEGTTQGPAAPAVGKTEARPPAPPYLPKPTPEAASADSPKPAPTDPVAPLPDLSRPMPAIPPVAPLPEPSKTEPPKTLAEPDDTADEPDWVEEDFEDGKDLEERAEARETDDPFDEETTEVAAAPADESAARPASGGGLFGSGLFSKLKLPGFGRRKAEEKAPEPAADEPDDLQDDLDDGFDDDLEEDFLEDEDEPAPGATDHELDVRRLHAVIDQLAADNLLDEALRRTGNRIELRKVEEGLDIVVKGLPAALGTVRLDETDGHVLYQPRFGLDLPEREPNRADLELWLKAMGDVVVHVLADIAQRRSKTGGSDSEPTA